MVSERLIYRVGLSYKYRREHVHLWLTLVTYNIHHIQTYDCLREQPSGSDLVTEKY